MRNTTTEDYQEPILVRKYRYLINFYIYLGANYKQAKYLARKNIKELMV